jgi:hypothetical protein
MKCKFEMTDMGLLNFFLGIEVEQTQAGIFINQEKYAQDLISKFGMSNAKAEATPMNSSEKLCLEDGSAKVDGATYRSLVGGLIYLTHTRPDLVYSVNMVAQFMHNPSKVHQGAARRILKYVAGTTAFGIWYAKAKEGEEQLTLRGYSDSDWASCIDDRKSRSAYVFSFGSGAVSWSSKKQASVALSTTEAEYIAANEATKQSIWLRRIMEDLNIKQVQPTVIYCDNKSAIHLSKNPVLHKRSKHIELCYHYIRGMVEENQVSLDYCSTHEQVADVLTKSLSKEKFGYFRYILGVGEFESREDDKM